MDFALDHADYGPAFRALIAQRVRGGVKKPRSSGCRNG